MQSLIQHPNYSHAYGNHKKKGWLFLGYVCKKCDHTIKSPNVLERHVTICRGRPQKQYKKEEIAGSVKDQYGNDWQPFKVIKTPF